MAVPFSMQAGLFCGNEEHYQYRLEILCFPQISALDCTLFYESSLQTTQFIGFDFTDITAEI